MLHRVFGGKSGGWDEVSKALSQARRGYSHKAAHPAFSVTALPQPGVCLIFLFLFFFIEV